MPGGIVEEKRGRAGRAAGEPIVAPARAKARRASHESTAVPALDLGSLFSSIAKCQPDAVAIESDDGSITYGALDARSDRAAQRLVKLGFGARTIVAVALPRSIDAIVTLLAVVKAGGTYLPLDPHHPAERLGFMIRDCGAGLLVTTPEIHDHLAQAAGQLPPFVLVADLDRATRSKLRADSVTSGVDLAYLMYTSGSTGKPKAVAVTHANVVNLAWQPSFADITRNDCLLQAAPLAFDASTFEIWGALLNGARLCLATEGAMDLESLAATMARGVTIAWLTAGLFAEVATYHLSILAGLRHLLVGGDVLSKSAVTRVIAAYPALRLTNGYGPTETTVFATTHDITFADLEGAIPIGRPLRNVTVHLLDPTLRPVAIGDVGELYVAGAGVARGYHNRPELTAERFVKSRSVAGKVLYRTGDLARIRDDGSVIEFLGRADDQIKLRGFRIEPGEIEAALRQVPGIIEASVQARSVGGDARLVAYLVPAAGSPQPDDVAVRTALATTLPDHMIPAAFVRLGRLPLTANGKLDRNALPDPWAAHRDSPQSPSNHEERLFCRLFAEICGTSDVAPDDDFFRIGGHSLTAMRLVARARVEAGVALTVRDVFERRTARSLAALARAGTQGARTKVEAGRGMVDDRPVLSLAQVGMWLADQIESAPEAYNIPFALDLRGDLDIVALGEAISDMVERHLPLRTRIEAKDGVPIARLAGRPDAPLLIVEPANDAASCLAKIREHVARPFDLSSEPAVRAHLFGFGPGQNLLCLTFHHGAADGESLPLFLRDLSAAYAARRAGNAPPVTVLTPSYADFAVAEQAWLESSGEEARQMLYWREELSPTPLPLDLPADHARIPDRSRDAGEVAIHIPASAADGLRQAASNADVTLFAVLASAFAALLARLSGLGDIVIGIPVAKRDAAELEDMVGLLANTLPLRIRVPDDGRLKSLVDETQVKLIEALSHADIAFERIVQVAAWRRIEGENPLFRVAFTWQGSPPGSGADFPGVEVAPHHVPAVKARFDLTLSLHPAPAGGIGGVLEYDASLFDRATVRAWLVEWHNILRAISRPEAAVAVPGATRRQARPGPVPDPTGSRPPSFQNSSGNFEHIVCRLYSEITGTADVGPDDDFFAIGGHSLTAMRLVARIAAETGVHFRPALLFGNPTPRRCAEAIAMLKSGDQTGHDVSTQAGKRPFFCVPGIGGSAVSLRHIAQELGDRPFVALGASLDDRIGESVVEMATRHIEEVRRIQPDGPYFLGGYSFGGLVAYEMAYQLQKQGEEIGLLAIIDSRWPLRNNSVADSVRGFGHWIGNLPGALVVEMDVLSWSGLRAKAQRAVRRVTDRVRRRPRRFDIQSSTRALDESELALWKSHFTAATQYSPATCRLPIDLFRAGIQPIGQPWAERTFGWKIVASRPVGVHVIPGNHVALLREGGAERLAGLLGAALDRAEGGA